jgi:deoxyribodipyrimidine photo-lyase
MKDPNIQTALQLIDDRTVIFWYRRDLRVEDNTALYYALRDNKQVLPVFIFDTVILGELDDKADKRVDFIHQSLAMVKNALEKKGSSLLVLYGDPVKIFSQLRPRAVYTNHDYESYARKRDDQVRSMLESRRIPFFTFKDHVIFEKDEVTKDNGEPYTIFTPYSRKWKSTVNAFFLKAYPVEKYLGNLFKTKSLPMPSLEEIGFQKSDVVIPERIIKTSLIRHYDQQRNFPALQGTSRLSVHLRFGTVSIRNVAAIASKINDTWLNELIWRDFYHMILWHFPHVENRSFKPAYDHIRWRNDPQEFEAWCKGQTGYPIVDAGMRELNATGFMHNRVRMITASFLAKHLLIDWRWGEAYFAKKLLDYDMAANNGGWQWAASSGCDAVPYFRIFNPELQTAKFDPEKKYIKTWVPEFGQQHYPAPIVQHTVARERAIRVYQDALNHKGKILLQRPFHLS